MSLMEILQVIYLAGVVLFFALCFFWDPSKSITEHVHPSLAWPIFAVFILIAAIAAIRNTLTPAEVAGHDK